MAYKRCENGAWYGTHKNKDGTYQFKTWGQISEPKAQLELLKWKAEIDASEGTLGKENVPIEKPFEHYLALLERGMQTDNILNRGTKSLWECAHSNIRPFVKTIKIVSEYNRENILLWKTKLETTQYKKGKFYAQDSIRTKLTSLRHFWYWMQNNGYMEEKLFKVKLPPAREDAGRALKPEERKQFLEALDPTIELFGLFLANTGGRLYETQHARLQDIDRVHKVWTIPYSKRGVNQQVGLSDEVIKKLPNGKNGWLFPHPDNPTSPVSIGIIKRHWQKAIEKSGIQGRLRRHDMRVTYATYYYKTHKRVDKLQNQLRWRDIKTAMHYTKQIDEDQVKDANNVRFE